MQQPFELDGILAHVSTSIGLTYYRNEDVNPAELLKRADSLLYEAKQAGRNTYRSSAALAEVRSPNAA
jgi:diguanylate cyclase (GGDEF)-like protein